MACLDFQLRNLDPSTKKIASWSLVQPTPKKEWTLSAATLCWQICLGWPPTLVRARCGLLSLSRYHCTLLRSYGHHLNICCCCLFCKLILKHASSESYRILNASVFFASDQFKHSIWIQFNWKWYRVIAKIFFAMSLNQHVAKLATATVGPWTAVSFTRWRPSTHFWIVIQLLAAYFWQTNSHIRNCLTQYRNKTAPMHETPPG